MLTSRGQARREWHSRCIGDRQPRWREGRAASFALIVQLECALAESSMQRISTQTHGTIDYAFSAVVAWLPKLLGMERKTTALLEANAGIAALYSAATNYEKGIVKVLPMKAHLTLDALSGGMMVGAAMMLEDESPRNRALIAGLGLFEIAAAVMTDPVPRHSVENETGPAARVRTAAGELVAAENI